MCYDVVRSEHHKGTSLISPNWDVTILLQTAHNTLLLGGFGVHYRIANRNEHLQMHLPQINNPKATGITMIGEDNI